MLDHAEAAAAPGPSGDARSASAGAPRVPPPRLNPTLLAFREHFHVPHTHTELTIYTCLSSPALRPARAKASHSRPASPSTAPSRTSRLPRPTRPPLRTSSPATTSSRLLLAPTLTATPSSSLRREPIAPSFAPSGVGSSSAGPFGRFLSWREMTGATGRHRRESWACRRWAAATSRLGARMHATTPPKNAASRQLIYTLS